MNRQVIYEFLILFAHTALISFAQATLIACAQPTTIGSKSTHILVQDEIFV